MSFYPIEPSTESVPADSLNKRNPVEQLHESTPYININDKERPDQEQQKKKKKQPQEEEKQPEGPYIDTSEHNIDEFV